MKRVLEAEWLDRLSANDQRAIQSRRDLRRVNWLMGNAGIVGRLLKDSPDEQAIGRLADLGGGDGTFLLRLAGRLSSRWKSVRAVVVDQQALVTDATRRGFDRLGWSLETVSADAFGWLGGAVESQNDVVLSNLFLHHFTSVELERLFHLISIRSQTFVACEPRRASLVLWASRLLGLIGGNAVTRHDGVASVRAGFVEQELSNLWPKGREWTLHEGRTGAFSHCFVARRDSAKEADPENDVSESV